MTVGSIYINVSKSAPGEPFQFKIQVSGGVYGQETFDGETNSLHAAPSIQEGAMAVVQAAFLALCSQTWRPSGVTDGV